MSRTVSSIVNSAVSCVGIPTPRTSLRRLLIAPVIVAAALLWTALPTFAATMLALDHPAWADPGVDHPSGPVATDETSWWPPGRRYAWTGQSTGATIERIDPWNPVAVGHLWTAGVATATGVVARWLWRGRISPTRRRPAPGTCPCRPPSVGRP